MKKTSILTLGLFVVGSIGFVGCEQKQGEQAATETITSTETTTNTSETESIAGFEAVYNGYLDIKESLFNDNPEEAKSKASKLQTEIQNSGIENKEPLANAASEIANTTDITKQRQAFAKLSEEFIGIVKNNKGAVDKAYIQHCPMALDNKGANWVSKTEEINNPYMGQKMPNCGSNKESI